MIVGPNWNGELPKGITAAMRSSTDLVFVVPRVFKDATPEDTAAVQPVIDQIVMYPLSQFDGKMKTKDYSKSPHFPVPVAGPHAPKGESQVGEARHLLRRATRGHEGGAAAAR